MDDRDRTIIQRLMDEGRTSWSDLSAEVGLSPPSIAERVRKLEERGVIRGYAAVVEPEAVGAETLAFVTMVTSGPAAHPEVARWVTRTPAVQECHIVSGDNDYLLKIRCRGTADLGRFLREELRAIEGVVRTVTTIALGTLKETTAVPLPAASENGAQEASG